MQIGVIVCGGEKSIDRLKCVCGILSNRINSYGAMRHEFVKIVLLVGFVYHAINRQLKSFLCLQMVGQYKFLGKG